MQSSLPNPLKQLLKRRIPVQSPVRPGSVEENLLTLGSEGRTREAAAPVSRNWRARDDPEQPMIADRQSMPSAPLGLAILGVRQRGKPFSSKMTQIKTLQTAPMSRS